MNAHFLEITIKAIVAGITIFILVRYIFFLKLEGFWNFVFPSKNRDVEPASEVESKPEAKQEAMSEPVATTVTKSTKIEPTPKPEVQADGDGIVGESKTVYIANPVSLKPTPHKSEDLERETLTESEAEPSTDEVEDSLDAENNDNTNVSELEPDEYYMESTVGDIDNGEFPTGATTEQIANAYEVARGMEVDEQKIEQAVDTLYAIRGNNFCDFIVTQSEKLFSLGQILEEHVENDGTLIKHLKSRKLSPEVVNFDISKYE